jgi:hypothetical protein
VSGRGRGRPGVVRPEAGDRLLLGREPVHGVVHLQRLTPKGRARVLRIRGMIAGRDGGAVGDREAPVLPPEGLKGGLEPRRGGHPETGADRRRAGREVPPVPLVPAVSLRPGEDRRGDLSASTHRTAESPGRERTAETALEACFQVRRRGQLCRSGGGNQAPEDGRQRGVGSGRPAVGLPTRRREVVEAVEKPF